MSQCGQYHMHLAISLAVCIWIQHRGCNFPTMFWFAYKLSLWSRLHGKPVHVNPWIQGRDSSPNFKTNIIWCVGILLQLFESGSLCQNHEKIWQGNFLPAQQTKHFWILSVYLFFLCIAQFKLHLALSCFCALLDVVPVTNSMLWIVLLLQQFFWRRILLPVSSRYLVLDYCPLWL